MAGTCVVYGGHDSDCMANVAVSSTFGIARLVSGSGHPVDGNGYLPERRQVAR
jgi:hypothetical protein